jgi:hypothetical protein
MGVILCRDFQHHLQESHRGDSIVGVAIELTLSTEFATDQVSIEGDVQALVCGLGIIQVLAGFIEVIAGVQNGTDGGYRSVRASLKSTDIGRVAAMANRIDGQVLTVHLTKE